MHEAAIARQIVSTALSAAREAGASRILEIRMSIGVLSGVEPVLLDKALEELTKGTLLEGARLTAKYIPPGLTCLDCGKGSEGRRGLYVCPFCGSEAIRLTGGSGYRLDELLAE